MRKDLYGRTWASVWNRAYLEGETKLIKSMLNNGYDVDAISKMVDLDKSHILNLINNDF